MRTALRSLFAACILLTVLGAAGADIPYLTGRVNDNAGVLSEATRRTLTERLKAHEEKTTNQVVVLTVPSLEGENIEDYAEAVFKAWKLGQKGKDNGILVVVAPNDRQMRIEVGYGLEGTLPDGAAGSIIRNVMTPRFSSGDINGGIEAGIDAILSVLETGRGPELSGSAGQGKRASPLSNFNGPDLPLIERILLGAFIFGIIGLFTVLGVMTPGMGWFLYVFLIPFWAMFPIIVVGTTGAFYLLITYLVVFPLAKLTLRRSDWYKKAAHDLRTKGKASIGGFSISSGGSGTSWSSGGSSSGFSGGGGSSGGGGASGSW